MGIELFLAPSITILVGCVFLGDLQLVNAMGVIAKVAHPPIATKDNHLYEFILFFLLYGIANIL